MKESACNTSTTSGSACNTWRRCAWCHRLHIHKGWPQQEESSTSACLTVLLVAVGRSRHSRQQAWLPSPYPSIAPSDKLPDAKLSGATSRLQHPSEISFALMSLTTAKQSRNSSQPTAATSRRASTCREELIPLHSCLSPGTHKLNEAQRAG